MKHRLFCVVLLALLSSGAPAIGATFQFASQSKIDSPYFVQMLLNAGRDWRWDTVRRVIGNQRVTMKTALIEASKSGLDVLVKMLLSLDEYFDNPNRSWVEEALDEAKRGEFVNVIQTLNAELERLSRT